MTIMNRAILPLFAATALLSGCISFGAKAPPTLLSLTSAASLPAGPARTGTAAEALVVLVPDTPRKLATNRLPVQIDASNIAYLKDAQWVDMPARLMRTLLAQTIAASGRMVLAEGDAGGKAQHFLSGELVEFGYDAGAREAVVVLDATRLVSGAPVQQRRFEARVPVTEAKAGPVGAALNSAANQVAGEVAGWVG